MEKYVIIKVMIAILEAQYPIIEGIRPETTAIGLPEYVKYIFNFSLWAAGLIVFIVLVYAGFRYLTSAGDPGRQRDAKDRIIAAFLGLAVLLFSYLILTTVNPQLVILSLPGLTTLPAPPAATPSPSSLKTLYYTEIPIGGLIELLFLEEKLTEINNLSQRVEEKAEEVRDLSQELKSFTDGCNCSYIDRGSCTPGACGVNGECSSDCYCYGEPREDFDPCPSRAAIDVRREDIKTALDEAETGLKDLQEEFGEVLADFRDLYNDFLSAKQLIKNCQGVGGRGGLRSLSSYNDFNEYLDVEREAGRIENFIPEFPFNYVSLANPYYLATFYCSESPGQYLQINSQNVSPELPEIISEEQAPSQEIFCGEEITIGQSIDNAQELASRILAQMENINSSALAEISNAEAFSDLPESCRGSNCNSTMNTGRTCCESVCAECNPPPEPTPEPSPPPEEPTPEPPPEDMGGWLDWLLFLPKPVHAQLECEEFGCRRYECIDEACTSCSCACTGSPCPVDAINNAFTTIINSYSVINSSQITLADLIRERVENRLRISTILNTLDSSQEELGTCFTPKEMYPRFERGEETEWESLTNCSTAREGLSIGFPLYDERGNEIENCYGSEPNLTDNFFCCFTRISF